MACESKDFSEHRWRVKELIGKINLLKRIYSELATSSWVNNEILHQKLVDIATVEIRKYYLQEMDKEEMKDTTREEIPEFKLKPTAPKPEYNPMAWNKYPEVEPPKNVPMRVEFTYIENPFDVDFKFEQLKCECRIFTQGGYWCLYPLDKGSAYPEEYYCLEEYEFKDLRFRPWDDEQDGNK